MITEAIIANVFVNAKGLKSFPSAAVIVNTGKKPTTVVATAVTIALATSLDARYITSSLLSPSFDSLRCFRMFSHITMPISTIVPIAIAIPDSATILASILKIRIAIKHISTAIGNSPLIKIELRRCITNAITTITVTSISSISAVSSVPSVS